MKLQSTRLSNTKNTNNFTTSKIAAWQVYTCSMTSLFFIAAWQVSVALVPRVPAPAVRLSPCGETNKVGEERARCLENQLSNQKLKSTTCAVSRKSALQQKTYYVLKLQLTGVRWVSISSWYVRTFRSKEFPVDVTFFISSAPAPASQSASPGKIRKVVRVYMRQSLACTDLRTSTCSSAS